MQSACPFYKGKLVADTHFAFVGVPEINGSPLTVAKWLELHPPTEQPKFYFNTDPWHAGQPHTDVATLEPHLYVVLREIVPGSTRKTPEEHVAMLPPEYESTDDDRRGDERHPRLSSHRQALQPELLGGVLGADGEDYAGCRR